MLPDRLAFKTLDLRNGDAKLSWSMFKSNLYVTSIHNVNDKQSYFGRISIQVSLSLLHMFIHYLTQLPKANKTIVLKVTKYVWVNNKPTKEVEAITSVHLGRTKEGIYYISLTQPEKPKIRYLFQDPKLKVCVDGEEQTTLTSHSILLSYVDSLECLIKPTLMKYLFKKMATP